MSDTVLPFPVPDEERARRLAIEVERLARLPTVEWMFYVAAESHAAKYGVDCATLKKMVEAVVRGAEKKQRDEQVEQHRIQARAEKKQEREDQRVRRDRKEEVALSRKEIERERKEVERARKEIERERKEVERARKEAEKIEREQEAKRVKREAAFAEIAELPKLTHQARLKEAAKRLGEDLALLTEEFEVFLAARAIPEELLPWPEPVNTTELLAAIETKFRRYVVASDAVIAASVLWPCFTYIAEVATHGPKLVYTFPERDAGKSTALHTLRWMSQRAYMAVDVTAAVTFRILDRLRPALFLDEADSAFSRGTVLATIFNTSWLNGGSKIPRTGRHGEIEEFECYGPQAFAMRKLLMPDTTLSRCIVCMMWPKLASEIVEDFGFCDDDEFKVIRRKAMRWAIDNAVALRSAAPVFPPGFTNRIRVNWKMLLAIAELAGGAWPKRARDAALALEIDRDEPSADIRLFQGLRDIWDDATEQNRSSQNICIALQAYPSGEWSDINPIGFLHVSMATQVGQILKRELAKRRRTRGGSSSSPWIQTEPSSNVVQRTCRPSSTAIRLELQIGLSLIDGTPHLPGNSSRNSLTRSLSLTAATG